MARNENPPFPRGAVGTGYDDPFTTNTTGEAQLEGMEWVFEDKDFSLPMIVKDRTQRFVLCRAVRNVSGGALLPKRFAKLSTADTAAHFSGQVNGYGALGNVGGVVDEWLPAAGAANNDIFWLVIEGPSTMTTDSSGATNITAGNMVIPGGSGNGTVVQQDVTVVSATNIYNQMQGAIGRAMVALNAISTDLLIDVRHY